MPRFDVTAPDGRTVEVTAPEGATEAQAIAYAQANWAALSAAAPKAGALATVGANLAGGFGSTFLGAGAALADYTGASDTAKYLDEKRASVQQFQKEHGGDTTLGRISSGAGSMAPALLEVAAAPFTGGASLLGLVANGALFAIPGFRDTYNEQIKEGAPPEVAAEKGLFNAGLMMVGGKLIATGGKALPKALQAGENLLPQLASAAGEGAVFHAANVAGSKAIDVANSRETEAPWVDPQGMAESAASFGILRGAHRAIDAPQRNAIAKAKADAEAAAAAKATTDKTAQDAKDAADPTKAQAILAEYAALTKQRTDLQGQLNTKFGKNDPDYAVKAAANKDLQEQIADLRAQEKEMVPSVMLARKLMEAQPKPVAEVAPAAGQEQDLFGAAPAQGPATDTLAAEAERKGYGVESRAADMEAALAGKDAEDSRALSDTGVEQTRSELTQQIAVMPQAIEQHRAAWAEAKDTDAEKAAAAKFAELQQQLADAQAQLAALPAAPNADRLNKSLATAVKAYSTAKEQGDVEAGEKAKARIAALQAQGATQAMPLVNTWGSEHPESFNQRVIAPEMAAGREAAQAQRKKLEDEQAALQRIAQAPVDSEAAPIRAQMTAQRRAADTLGKQSQPIGGAPPVQGESELRALVHRGAGLSTRSMEGRTVEDALRDLDLAKSRRDKDGVSAAVEEIRDFREKEKQAEAVPLGYVTSQWRGDQPPDVAAHQDALIARRQGLTQLLMAKPAEREAAAGTLRARIVTEIETAWGKQTTKAERQQIAAMADPIITKLMALKKPTMTAAREAQAALDAVRNKFTKRAVDAPIAEPMGPREARGTELLREQAAGSVNADLLQQAPRKTFKPEAAPESEEVIVAREDTRTANLKAEQQDIDARLAAHKEATAKQQAAEERALSAGDIATTKGYASDDVAAAIARNATERMDLQGRIEALQARNHALDEWMLDVEPDAATRAEKADVQESLNQAQADMPLLEAAQSTLLDRTRALRKQGEMPAETPGLRTKEELSALHERKQDVQKQLAEIATEKAAEEQAARQTNVAAGVQEQKQTEAAAAQSAEERIGWQKRKEELGELPGVSITHQAAEAAARLIETGPDRIARLQAKIADPEATKTTRDNDKNELKNLLRVLQMAHDMATEKEGAGDAVEKRIVEISDKIAAYQEQIDAGQPRKYRMEKIAELQRERTALRKAEKGTFNPPTKTPISGMAERRAAAEDRKAKLFLEQSLAIEQEGTSGKLPAGRISQASRKEVIAGDQRTGTPESVAGENKTGTRNPIQEQRRVTETNRAVGKPEQRDANKIADELGVATPTTEKTPLERMEELISIKQGLLREKLATKEAAEKRAAEQLAKNEKNTSLTDEQRREAEEEIKTRPDRIETEIKRLEVELDKLALEAEPLRDAAEAAAERAAKAKAEPQASIEDAKAAVAESTAKPKAKKTKRKGLSETAEETAGAVDDVYYDSAPDDAFTRATEDPFAGEGEASLFSRGKAAEGHTTDSLVAELKPHFGGKDVRSRVNVYNTVAAMIKAHPEYQGRIPADTKGFVDGTHAFLIAENIGKGEGLSVLVHEIGTHIGMRNLFAPALYKALVTATKNWAGKKDGSLESRIAQAAKARVEKADTPAHKYDDEILAHTIEEAMKAGVSPTKLSGKGPIGQFIGRIMQAMQKILQRYGIAPNSLNMQHLVDMAYGAAGKELGSNGPRHGGAKLFTYAGEISHGADDTSWVKAHEMLAAGEHPAQVFRDTGWFVGADGKMRYEIDDSKSKVTLPDEAHALSYTKPDDKYKTTLEAIFEHPDLYKAYPELAKYPVEFVKEPNNTKAWMSTETLGINMYNMGGGDDFHKSLLHEVQHAIQEREGFTRGASTENAYVNIGNPEHNRAIAAYYDRKGDSSLADMAREHAEIVAPLYPAFEKADAEYRAYRDSDQYKKDAEAYKKAIAEYEEKRERLVVEVEALKAEHAKAKEAEKAAWKEFMAAKTMAEIDRAKEVLRPINAKERELSTKLHNLQMEQIRLHSPSPEHTFKSIDLMAAASEAGKPLWEASEKFFDNHKTSSKRFARLFMADTAYRNKYGEVEARDTSARKDLTAEQRRQERPYSSQDVYKEDLLFSRGAATGNPLLDPLANEPPKDKRGFFRKTFDGLGHKIAAGAFDMKDPVLRAMHAEATRTGNWHDFYQAAHDMRKADMSINVLKSILSVGAPDVRTDEKGYKIFSAGKGVSGVDLFKLAEKVPGTDGDEKFKQITRYMTALQGTRLGADRVGMTPKEVKGILAHVDATPALKAALEAFRDAYHEYNTKLVNAVRDAGELTPEKAREMLRHRDYAPKYRKHNGQVEMSVGDNRWESIGDIATTPFMHAFKGSDEAIMPINESIMYNTNLLATMATTNMAKRNIAHVMQQAGLPAKKMFIRKGDEPKGKDILKWRENGEKRWLRIDTEGTSMDGVPPEMLAESIEGFHGTMPMIVKASAKLGDLLRAGVTRSPMYTLRQLLKDPVGAASTSGVDANPLTAIARTAKQYAAAFTGGNAELEAVNRNALVQSNILTGDRDDMVKAATQYANGGSQSAYRKLMNALDRGAANADAATRAMIYKDSTDRGLSELEASYRVMESMNFHKRGAWSSVQYLNRMIPFFNAGLQGLNVTYRAMTGGMPFNEKLQVQQRFVNNALLLATGALAYAAIMDDDPEYKKLKASDKYGALHFRVPGSDALFKLPVGFQEVGLPWAAGQALFDTFADNSEGKQIVKALFKYAMGAVPGVSSAGVPQGLKQVLETATNTDFFSWNPIVPPRLENELPELQYTGTTPEVLKALGKLGISPIKAQHFLEGLFSRIATDVLHTADIAWESAVGDSGVEKTARTLKDMPFFSSAVQGTTSSAAKEDVYEWANKVKKVNDSFSDIKKKMDAPRIQEFAKEHRFELASAQAAGAYTKLMGELSTNIRQLDYIPKMSSEEKLQRKKKLEATQEVISQNYKKVMERIALNVGGT